MTEIDTTVDDRPIGIIPIHFDVPVHYIPYATFDEAASAVAAALDAFNRELYDGQLKYELLVFPSEEGSFLSRWGIRILAGIGAIGAFTAHDFGKGFVRRLTNHTVEELGEIVASYAETRILDAVNAVGTTSRPKTASLPRCDRETAIITETTKSFLQTDQTHLNGIGITPRKYRDAYDARNGFYQACAKDQKVQGIGFDETSDFPIKRKRFAELLVPLPPREEPTDAKAWQVEIVTIHVTSPNWDAADHKRPWKGKDDKGRERLFRIYDKQFWRLVQQREIDPRIIDTMKVQMAFVGPQRRDARVLRVLEYNDQVLGAPLDANALEAVLGEFNAPPEDGTPDFFGR